MKKAVVSVVKGRKNPDEREIDQLIRKAVELIGGIKDIISTNDLVLIKPNLAGDVQPIEAGTTDPRVIRSIAHIVREMGAKLVIAEASGAGVDTESAFRVAGYDRLRKEGFEVIDLKNTEVVKISVPKGKVLKEVPIFKLVMDAHVRISVPVMKTHDNDPVTLSLKNMKGVIPDSEKKKFHTTLGVFQALADLNTVVKPNLVIVDGIIGGEGLGEPWKIPVEMDLIIAGKDPVAVDSVTAQIMGVNPQDIMHLKFAEEHGIGVLNPDMIQVIGEKISDVTRRFKSAGEHSQEMVDFRELNLVFSDKTCTGCRGMLYFFLKMMKDSNKLDNIKHLTFIEGKDQRIPEGVKKEGLILIGVCTEELKEKGRYIPGCPPLSFMVATHIFGEDFKPVWT